MARKILLACGVLSPLLYALADLLGGIGWQGYSFRDQTISELGAIGAPSRSLFAAMLIPVYVLLLACGLGVWRSADSRRGVRVVGGLLVAFSVMALTAGQFASMQTRGTEQGLSGALHLVEGAVAMAMVTVAMVVTAVSLGGRFRLYTIAAIVVMVVFGFWSAADAPRIAEGLSTPWVGVKERIFWYDYWSWFAALAVTLLRGPAASAARDVEYAEGRRA